MNFTPLSRHRLETFSQLDKADKTLRSAVLNTPGTHIAFRVGGEDADVLRKDFAPWPAEELADLDNYTALIKPLLYGEVKEPFKIQTYKVPPHLKLRSGRSQKVANYSRDNYGTPRAEVEAEISRWMQGVGREASIATLERIARTIAPRKNRG